MRTFAILASLVVFCSAFSTADSITITRGHGVLDNSGAAATYHFGFSGSGKGISVPFPQDDWEGQRSLVFDCNPCDPRTTAIDLLTNGGDVHLHDNVFTSGFMDYHAVSFVSSLVPNGILTVDYRATADLLFFRCSGAGGFCDHQIGPTFVSDPSQLWFVRASFTPFDGQYVFQKAAFSTSPIPEPSPFLLMGSGLVGLASLRYKLLRFRPPRAEGLMSSGFGAYSRRTKRSRCASAHNADLPSKPFVS
jgi:hypothetical protein